VLYEIASYRDIAAERLDKLNPDYVTSLIDQLMLNRGFEKTAKNAVEITRRLLRP